MGLLLFLVKTVLKLLLSIFTHTQNAPTWGVNCNYIFSNFFFKQNSFRTRFFQVSIQFYSCHPLAIDNSIHFQTVTW